MTNFRFVILFSLCATNAAVNAQTAPGVAPNVANDPTWQLIWSDEFENSDGPLDCDGGNSRWIRKNNFDHFGYNDCVFIDANAYEFGGNLVLRFAQESYSCPEATWVSGGCKRQADPAHLPYTTTGGYVISRNDHTQYGYVEAEIKLDYADSLIAAFWTLGDVSEVVPAIPLTNAGEIDIFEMTWGDLPGQTSTITTNLHYQYANNDVVPPVIHLPNPPAYYATNTGISYDNVWRKFSMEWNPQEIIWYYEGVEFRRIVGHYVDDPLKMLFTFGLQVNYAPGPNTPDEVFMLIKYIRVYQQHGDCNIVNTCSYNLTQHPVNVKQSITIGGSGCSNVQPIGSVVHLVATDFVKLDGEFEVPLGSELVISIANDCY